jgi:hypothetical protein
MVFLATALFIILCIASVPGGSFFSRLSALTIILICLCLLAALYLERWTFDKEANLLEKNIGILFAYARKKMSLDALQKVVLHETASGHAERPGLLRLSARRTAVLLIVDRDEKVYRLDIASGGSVREMRRSAQRLSAFCAIPLEDDGADSPT